MTPEAGTKAARLAMKHGRIAWAGVDGTWVTVYDIAKGTTQSKRISGFLFNYVSDIQITSDRVFWRETGGFLIPSTTFMSAPLDDLTKAAKLRYPSSAYVAQFSVNDEYFAYSTYDLWGAVGSWSGPGKAMVARTADVIAGGDDYSRISCSSGAQLAPSLGDGQRVAWLDTTAAATDVVTRETFAGACEWYRPHLGTEGGAPTGLRGRPALADTGTTASSPPVCCASTAASSWRWTMPWPRCRRRRTGSSRASPRFSGTSASIRSSAVC